MSEWIHYAFYCVGATVCVGVGSYLTIQVLLILINETLNCAGRTFKGLWMVIKFKRHEKEFKKWLKLKDLDND